MPPKTSAPSKKPLPAKSAAVSHARPKPHAAVHGVARPAGRYVEAVGRRKTAVAVVRLFMSGGEKGLHMTVNDRALERYFPLRKLREVAIAPFGAVAVENAHVTVKATGGGINAQAEAVRLGIARALIAIDPNHRSRLKALGYVKRDPRMVERKKPGLRKARRPQQWRKR